MGNFDFTGFQFGDWKSHDEETGAVTVLRVSSGDRYNETLHPEVRDKVVEVPGMDGSYYFGSDYGPMQFDIEIAFDHLTEEQFRELRRTFGTKEIKKLIFDERPYKYYMTKLASPIELSYVCFDERKINGTRTENGIRRNRDADYYETQEFSFRKEIEIPAGETVTYDYTSEHIPIEEEGKELSVITSPVSDNYDIEDTVITFRVLDEPQTAIISFFYTEDILVPAWEQADRYVYSDTTERIYKGEGKISLIAYFPFAKSEFKVLPEGSEDWAISSGILSASDMANIDVYKNFSGTINGFETYNPGDLPTGVRIYCPFNTSRSLNLTYQQESGTNSAFLNMAEIPEEDTNNNIGFLIDTNIGLVYGVTEFNTNTLTYKTSNHIYNQYVASGYFFKLEPNTILNSRSRIIVKGTNNATISPDDNNNIYIFYDYLYF